MRKLSNISINEMRKVLKYFGLGKIRTKGGHEAWVKKGMTRPVILQTHVEPIPEFIVNNIIRNLGVSRNEFFEVLDVI